MGCAGGWRLHWADWEPDSKVLSGQTFARPYRRDGRSGSCPLRCQQPPWEPPSSPLPLRSSSSSCTITYMDTGFCWLLVAQEGLWGRFLVSSPALHMSLSGGVGGRGSQHPPGEDAVLDNPCLKLKVSGFWHVSKEAADLPGLQHARPALPCCRVGVQHPLHPPVGSALPWQGAGSHCSSHYTQGCRGSVQSDGSSVTPPPQWHKSVGPAHVLLAPCAVAAAVGGGAAVSPPCCSPAWHLCVVACEQWADSVTLINTGSAMALRVCAVCPP